MWDLIPERWDHGDSFCFVHRHVPQTVLDAQPEPSKHLAKAQVSRGLA